MESRTDSALLSVMLPGCGIFYKVEEYVHGYYMRYVHNNMQFTSELE